MNAAVLLVDIGGTSTRLVVAHNPSLEGAAVTTMPTIYDYPRFVADLAARATAAGCRSIRGAFGVSFDYEAGRIAAAGKMPDFVGRPIFSDLSAASDAEVHLAHDCVCALLGEMRGDSRRRTGYVTVSTGLGAAVCIGSPKRRLIFRVRLAHHVIVEGGDACSCGRRGCLAAYVDGSQWLRRLGRPLDEVDDPAFWATFANHLSHGLANFATLFDLDEVVLGGGIVLNRPQLWAMVASRLSAARVNDGYRATTFRHGVLGRLAPLIGAWHLPDAASYIAG